MGPKKWLVLLLALLVFTGCSRQDNKITVLKLANDDATGYSSVLANQYMAKVVKKRTNGRIVIEVYPDAQLGDGKEVIEAVQMNAIQMANVGSNQISEFNRKIRVLELPYVVKDKDHLWRILNSDIGQEFLAMEDIQLVGLTYYNTGSRNFYNSKQPITRPEELKGMRIRSAPAPLTIEMIQALGASVTPIPFSEVYSALQNHVVEGAECDLTSYYTKGHYETARYFTWDEHTMNPEMMIISKTAWDRLSAADQKILREAAAESQKINEEEQVKQTGQAYETLKAKGVVFTKIDDKQAWTDAAAPVIEKNRAVYRDLLQRIARLQ
ncbi:MAG: TRAP transporter substrate-binding protein [Negativicutes bacterium]|nr:TRAP transporter substrate-binding protein [Negativicutes bacterium]